MPAAARDEPTLCVCMCVDLRGCPCVCTRVSMCVGGYSEDYSPWCQGLPCPELLLPTPAPASWGDELGSMVWTPRGVGTDVPTGELVLALSGPPTGYEPHPKGCYPTPIFFQIGKWHHRSGWLRPKARVFSGAHLRTPSASRGPGGGQRIEVDTEGSSASDASYLPSLAPARTVTIKQPPLLLNICI